MELGSRQHIPTEKKLQLVRMLRSEDEQNRVRMRTREELLYGRAFPEKVSAAEPYGMEGEIERPAFSSLKLRFVIAFLLMVGFVSWDNGYYPIPGVEPELVYECLSADNSIGNLFAFIEQIPYTLESDQ